MRLAPHKEAWIRKGLEQRIAPLSRSDITRIAIIKHGALGDLVHTRPMILALREHFPDVKITFSTISHYMNGVPEDIVDRVHITCGKDKKFSELEKWRSMRELGEHDIIFDISQTSRSHWISLLNKARIKIGFRHKGLERFVYDIAINRAHYRFEAETFLEQVHLIGCDYIWPLEYGYSPLDTVIEGEYLLYFPTASDNSKIWHKERFAELINQSMEEHAGYQHVILTGIADWEKQLVNEIADRVHQREKLRIIEGGEKTEALVDNAVCLVANDTGIRNLAIARNTPTLGIFPNGMLFGYLPRFGLHKVAYTPDNSSPAVDDVYKKLNRLLVDISQHT